MSLHCPLCHSALEFSEDYGDTQDFWCDKGHLVQYCRDGMFWQALIIGPDGDEIYGLEFNLQFDLIRLRDWFAGLVNLEGELA